MTGLPEMPAATPEKELVMRAAGVALAPCRPILGGGGAKSEPGACPQERVPAKKIRMPSFFMLPLHLWPEAESRAQPRIGAVPGPATNESNLAARRARA